MIRRNAEENSKALIVENDNVYIINNPKITNIFSIYLTSEIGESKNYRDVFNLLREAQPEDVMILYLNNHGGYVDTGIDIINAMKASNGQVYTYLTGPVYSMAPLIALAGQKIFIEEDVFMMFHDYSGADEGKGHEMSSRILFEKPYFDSMFERLTKGFLTKQEIKQVNKGQDLYINREDIIKRLKRIKKLGNGEGK